MQISNCSTIRKNNVMKMSGQSPGKMCMWQKRTGRDAGSIVSSSLETLCGVTTCLSKWVC